MESCSLLLELVCPRVDFLWPDPASGPFAPPGAWGEGAMVALEPGDEEKRGESAYDLAKILPLYTLGWWCWFFPSAWRQGLCCYRNLSGSAHLPLSESLCPSLGIATHSGLHSQQRVK